MKAKTKSLIAVDTNVLVRFLVQDDQVQANAATKLFRALTVDQQAFLSREVVLETVWVLERAYRFDRTAIGTAIDGLLEARELVIEDADQIGLAIHRYLSGGPGFADHLILAVAQAEGCETVYTFDKKAAKEVGATLLQTNFT